MGSSFSARPIRNSTSVGGCAPRRAPRRDEPAFSTASAGHEDLLRRRRGRRFRRSRAGSPATRAHRRGHGRHRSRRRHRFGQGGVGKSTLTMQLALALERAGRQCAILDADLNGPCQARLAGLEHVPCCLAIGAWPCPRTPHGLGVVSVGSMVPESEHLEFESVAKGDSHVWRATREFNLFQQLLGLVDWGRLDFLLGRPAARRRACPAVRRGPGAGRALRARHDSCRAGPRGRRALGGGARHDAERGARVHREHERLLLRNVRRRPPLFDGAAGEAPELGLPCLAKVPFDPRLAAASDAGETDLAPGPVIRAIDEAAASILSRLTKTT